MHPLSLLRDLVVLVAVAIPVVALAQRLKVPSVVGFLLTGLLIGPHALGLIGEAESVRGLAELGVLLLLFTIGLELSLSRIIRMGRIVVQGGGIQVLGTIALISVAAIALAGIPVQRAVFLGFLFALSSTAIVLKVYAERGELDTPHGRVVVGVLLFQDLCIVPLMLLTPLLAGGEGGSATLRQVILPLVAVGVLVLGGRVAIPWLLERVAGLRNREIFTLCIVLVGLGAAYLTASVGLSLALGAFLAGLIVSESEYGIQALSDILPFRDTFSGIFFISVGMLLDLGFVLDNLPAVIGLTLGVTLTKLVTATAATRSLRRSIQVSLLSGLGLAQVGEFSFVLALVGAPLGLLPGNSYQLFLATSVLTMLAAPFLIGWGYPITDVVCRAARQPMLEIPPHDEAAIRELTDHVIIVGYGVNGRNLARVLKAAGIPYVILEQNGQVVRRARLEREPIYFGDGARREVLHRVGIERARVIVYAISAPVEERRGVAIARQLNPNVRIVVRTRYVVSIDELQAQGADEVVPEEFETSIEIFSRVLRLYGVPRNMIEREVEAVRGEGYEMLRGLKIPDLKLDALAHLGVRGTLDTIQVEPESAAVGENPVTMSLRRETGAMVIAAVRDGTVHYTPDPAFRFQAGDVVVLVGDREALDRAGQLFRAGGE